jgi:hypothetical protein
MKYTFQLVDVFSSTPFGEERSQYLSRAHLLASDGVRLRGIPRSAQPVRSR